MKVVPFYKTIGGYETYAKIRGRWYFVCGPGFDRQDFFDRSAFFDTAKRLGVELKRTGVKPRSLAHAGTLAQVLEILPRWTPEIGF